MGVESFANKTFKLGVSNPAGRINEALDAAKYNKAGVLLAETVKEGVLLPFYGAGAISNWAFGKMATLLEGTVKLGVQSAMLIPLPILGMKNAASLRGDFNAARETIRLKSEGNPQSFAEIFSNIRNVRDNAAMKTSDASSLAA